MVVLAKAWVAVSNDPIVGTAQKASTFWGKVKAKFDELSPAEYESGLFKDRGLSSMKSFWNDQLHPEANKFQDRVTRVLAAKLTGNLTEQEKINIAVALHCNKITTPHYDYRNFETADNWKFYSAWYEVMRHQPKWSCKNLINTSNAVAAVAAAAAAAPAVSVGGPPVALAAPAAPTAAAAAAAAVVAAAAEGATSAASVPGNGVPLAIIAAAPGTNSTGPETGSSDTLTDDVSVASVAVADPCSATSRKRGGFPGRNKAKNAVKKGKLEEKKKVYLEKKEQMMGNYLCQMKEQTKAAKKHASTGGKLEKILDKNHKLAAKKEKKSDLKFMLKIAQKNGDQEMYKKTCPR